MFSKILTSTQHERDSLAAELRYIHAAAVADEAQTFAVYRANKRKHTARAAWLESLQRLAAFNDLFYILGINADTLADEYHKNQNKKP